MLSQQIDVKIHQLKIPSKQQIKIIVTVLGCGALGKLWLTAFIRQGHIVQGWLQVPKRFFTVNIRSYDGIESIFLLPANNVNLLNNSEILLVTLKARHVSKAIRKILPKLRSNCIILLIHNGLGIKEELPKLIQPLLLGTTTHAAYSKEGKIYHISTGITSIGPGNTKAKSCNQIIDILHQVMPKVIWYNNITISSWIKLAVNCVINPLSVVYNCCNGELEHHYDEITAICREVIIVMNYEGYNPNYDLLLLYICKVIHNTSSNISSMLQDIRANKISEIDYINGYLLKRARFYGLKLPVNQWLFNYIKDKEQRYK